MPCRACVHLSACIDSDMLSDMHNHQTSSAVDRAARRTGMSYHAMQPRPGSSTGKPRSLRSSRVTVWTEHLPPSKRCRRNRVQEAREKARPGALCTESPSWSEASERCATGSASAGPVLEVSLPIRGYLDGYGNSGRMDVGQKRKLLAPSGGASGTEADGPCRRIGAPRRGTSRAVNRLPV